MCPNPISWSSSPNLFQLQFSVSIIDKLSQKRWSHFQCFLFLVHHIIQFVTKSYWFSLQNKSRVWPLPTISPAPRLIQVTICFHLNDWRKPLHRSIHFIPHSLWWSLIKKAKVISLDISRMISVSWFHISAAFPYKGRLDAPWYWTPAALLTLWPYFIPPTCSPPATQIFFCSSNRQALTLRPLY